MQGLLALLEYEIVLDFCFPLSLEWCWGTWLMGDTFTSNKQLTLKRKKSRSHSVHLTVVMGNHNSDKFEHSILFNSIRQTNVQQTRMVLSVCGKSGVVGLASPTKM